MEQIISQILHPVHKEGIVLIISDIYPSPFPSPPRDCVAMDENLLLLQHGTGGRVMKLQSGNLSLLSVGVPSP
jgi:hypothetical protein